MAIRNRILSAHLNKGVSIPFSVLAGLHSLRPRIKHSHKAQSMQFPYVIRALSLLIANGLPIAVAISWLAPRLSGFWCVQLSSIAKSLELGASLEAELERLSSEVPLAEVEEFAQKLIIALDRGVPISAQLSELAGSLEAEMIRKLSKRAGANETKMLIPTIFLILPVTVLFAVFPSLLVLQASY